MVYYNEIDPYAAQWLRNLIQGGHIAKGEVDERSIHEIQPNDLRGFAQCHFFAGIGVWSYALRLSGWGDDRPVWTGSCPCQPFSSAGRGGGVEDPRHLWPELFRLIRECQPAVVFGEQVASPAGLQWLDLVQADLESAGYASGAADLCAAGVGAPHVRQRLYWVAKYWSPRFQVPVQQPGIGVTEGILQEANVIGDGGLPLGVAHLPQFGRGQGDPISARSGEGTTPEGEPRRSAVHSFWHPADWLPCLDGKSRPVEPGTFPLAHGSTARVGRLRAYGNAIVPQVASAFISAYLDGHETSASRV